MAQQNFQWGVIGTGAIATDFATALQSSERCRIVNVTSIMIEDPWLPGGKRQGLESHFTIERDGQPPEVVNVDIPRAIYALEAELVADSLPATQAIWPAMTWDDTLANLRVMDTSRAAIGQQPL
jgi:hypothetical protein